MAKPETLIAPLPLSIPTCSIEQYAIANDVTERTVKHWIERDYLPSVKMGRKRLINLAKLTQKLLEHTN